MALGVADSLVDFLHLSLFVLQVHRSYSCSPKLQKGRAVPRNEIKLLGAFSVRSNFPL